MDKFAAPKTHRAAKHAVERDGNYRRIHIFHDVFDAAPERQKLADTRDLSLGKNADDFAIADGVARGLQRGEQFARTLFGRNGNGIPDFCERFYPRFFVDVFEHQKTDGPVGRSDEQERVGEGNVVANEERAAFFRNVISANNADAINGIRHTPQGETQQRIGQQPHGVNRREEC